MNCTVPSPTRPALRYHGGKFRLASWVISHFPRHRIYVEPFGGAASVLLRKPRAWSEIYNDMDAEVVTLFRVLRNREKAAELVRLLELTPYAREEFEAAYEDTDCEIEVARRLCVRSFMGFGSSATVKRHRTGWRSNSNRSGTTPAHDWMHYPDALCAVIERLRGVVIECRPAIDVLQLHDHVDALHYVDPPYVQSTRVGLVSGRGNHAYNHEMSDDDHRELATVLRGLCGAVVLSGYPCALYDRELYPDWRRVERRHHADGARSRTEVLWLNDKAAGGTVPLDFGTL